MKRLFDTQLATLILPLIGTGIINIDQSIDFIGMDSKPDWSLVYEVEKTLKNWMWFILFHPSRNVTLMVVWTFQICQTTCGSGYLEIMKRHPDTCKGAGLKEFDWLLFVWIVFHFKFIYGHYGHYEINLTNNLTYLT